jgi:hypothetical protein
MGSWNETCGLSNLPITYKTPCLLFLLVKREEDRNAGGFPYPSGSWRPISLPLHGTYDDYGILELDASANEVFMPYIKERFLDAGMVNGDCAQFLRDVERGKVRSPHRLSHVLPDRPIGQMLVRKDVWDYLLKVKWDRGWTNLDGSTLRRDAEAWIDDLLKLKPKLEEAPLKAFSLTSEFDMDQEAKHPRSSVSRALYSSACDPCVITRTPLEMMILGWGEKNMGERQEISREEAISVLIAAGEVSYVDALMGCLRRAWRPQPGKGSQDTEWQLHCQFSLKIAEIAQETEKKDDDIDEDEDEDEDEDDLSPRFLIP